ncbi:MAG: hypothetical protein PVG19_03480 [Desulfobacterales bacterium]|jgi:hypothetical protein
MEDKIIRVETKANIDQQALDRLLMLVPAHQREDKRLIRFLAFRLKIDGFDTTKMFLSRQLIAAERCRFRGDLYDFLKDDEESKACRDI